MSHLQISLLGPFRVTLNGDPVTQFRADTARALLAYLALHAGTPCRRETLAALLWPDQPESEARHNLRQALSRLRTAIGDREADPPLLLATRKTIQFNPQSDPSTDSPRPGSGQAGQVHSLDVAAFDGRIAACREHPHPVLEACPSCMQRLEEAVELYRGDLLAGFSLPSAPFEEWLVVEREGRHRHALDALYHLAAYHIDEGAYDHAGRYARRQLELEPWREAAHRQLMRALAYSGERGAALRQYEECQRVLQAELDVSPQEETVGLYHAIRGHREPPPPGAVQPEPPPPVLPTGTVTFLFTDIQGSTPLWEQKPQSMKAALARHHAILHQAIRDNGGTVFKIVGDAFQAAFDLASNALSAALAAQYALCGGWRQL